MQFQILRIPHRNPSILCLKQSLFPGRSQRLAYCNAAAAYQRFDFVMGIPDFFLPET